MLGPRSADRQDATADLDREARGDVNRAPSAAQAQPSVRFSYFYRQIVVSVIGALIAALVTGADEDPSLWQLVTIALGAGLPALFTALAKERRWKNGPLTYVALALGAAWVVKTLRPWRSSPVPPDAAAGSSALASAAVSAVVVTVGAALFSTVTQAGDPSLVGTWQTSRFEYSFRQNITAGKTGDAERWVIRPARECRAGSCPLEVSVDGARPFELASVGPQVWIGRRRYRSDCVQGPAASPRVTLRAGYKSRDTIEVRLNTSRVGEPFADIVVDDDSVATKRAQRLGCARTARSTLHATAGRAPAGG